MNEIEMPEENLIVTAGADSRILVSDLRKSIHPIVTISSHKDFIYSMRIGGRYILSGAGDGMLLVHEMRSGKLLYGVGANKAGVRCIECRDEFLVAAGDDGTAITYFF